MSFHTPNQTCSTGTIAQLYYVIMGTEWKKGKQKDDKNDDDDDTASFSKKGILLYPYEVDYNDHFETPLVAYQDILPLLDFIGSTMNRNKKKSTQKRQDHIIYDPYYCNGRTKELLHSLGFTNVKHEKRDFYQDISNNQVPFHHSFITNPPYSSTHKERCLQYAVDNLRTKSIPFFILMPNYVALKEYFRSTISNNNNKNDDDPFDIFYILPSIPYEYDHPEGTGHEVSPFASIWFCGIPTPFISKAKNAFISSKTKNNAKWASSLLELRQFKAIPTEKRKNPKQRKKKKQKLFDTIHQNTTTTPLYPLTPQDNHKKKNNNNNNKKKNTTSTMKNEQKTKKKEMKRSIHRDEFGVRKKKRF